MEKRNVIKTGVAVVLLGMIFVVVFPIVLSKTPMDSVGEEGKASPVSADIQVTPATSLESSQEKTAPPAAAVKIRKHRDGKALWAYNTQTKCLVISGKGKISSVKHDGRFEDDIPLWEEPCFQPQYYQKVEKIVIKPGITSVNEGAFSGFASLQEIQLPDTVTEIKKYTFYACEKLQKITFGKHMQKMDDTALMFCKSLQAITFPADSPYFIMKSGIMYNRQKMVLIFCPRDQRKAVIAPETREIADLAFAHCNGLKEIVIPAAVEKIGDKVFYQCRCLEEITFAGNSHCQRIGSAFLECKSLRKIRLPDSVKCVGTAAFQDCKSLRHVYLGRAFLGFGLLENEEVSGAEVKKWNFWCDDALQRVDVSEDNPRYCSRNGVVYDKNKTKLLYYPPANKTKVLRLPDTVQIIQGGAASDSKYLEKVIFPESLKRIGQNAFCWGKRLKTVSVVGEDVVIRGYAFGCCQSLSDVTLGEGIRKIGEDAFLDTGFNEIYIPASVKKIGDSAFGVRYERTKLEGGSTRIEALDIFDFVIYGKKGSAAHRYAKSRIIDFVEVK